MKILLVLMIASSVMLCNAKGKHGGGGGGEGGGEPEKLDIMHILEHFMGPRENYFLFHEFCPDYLEEEYDQILTIANAAHAELHPEHVTKKKKRQFMDWYAPIREVLLKVAKNLLNTVSNDAWMDFHDHYCSILEGMDAMWKTDPVIDLRAVLETLTEEDRDQAMDRWCGGAAEYLLHVVHMFSGDIALSEFERRSKRDVAADPEGRPLEDIDYILALSKIMMMFDEEAHGNLATEVCGWSVEKREPGSSGVESKRMGSLAKKLLLALKGFKN